MGESRLSEYYPSFLKRPKALEKSFSSQQAQCDVSKKTKVRLFFWNSLGTDFLSSSRHCFSTILTLKPFQLLLEEDI